MANYCRCGPRFSFDQARKVLAPANWQAKEAWYCHRCEKISHAVQEPVAVIRGPHNARNLFHAQRLPNGQHLIYWKVGSQHDEVRTDVTTVEFFPWPRRPDMSETEPLIFKTWELLMTKVAVIMRPVEGPGDNAIQTEERERAKYEARGIAEALAILMKPFMESADHVVKCAVKRYKDDKFEVPGLGAHLFDQFRNPDGTDRTAISTPKAAPAAKKVVLPTGKALAPKDAEGIKEAVGSGLFSKEDIAKMYKVSLKQVEEACA